MHLMEAFELAKDWAGTPILEAGTFALDPGEKVGLIGPNGAGKTSILRILCGKDGDYHGRLKIREGLRIGYVPQHFEPPGGLSAAEILLAPARKFERALGEKAEELARNEGPELERALREYGELRAAYEVYGAEEASDRAGRLIERLGLGSSADREARLLSGGEKNILALGAVLMEDPDLLFLDEPGNHLDFVGLAWLEEFLRGERRAVLVVSHNRYLLDRTVDRILELDHARLTPYSGGYSAYRLEKLKRAAGQGRDWQADRAKIERLETLVARFAEIARSRPDPAWGKRLRARRSQLEREKARAAERPELGHEAMKLVFDAPESKADFALVLRHYSKAYGERLLFEDVGFDLLVGERAAIIGPNGSGKTSLLRDIVVAAGCRDGGPVFVGPSLRIGYCAQEQELFDFGKTVAEEFSALGARDAETAKLLRRFLFDRSVLERRVGALSGGERNRLQIARAIWLKANFLILDEPTNHLDIEGREAVEEGLAEFQGSLLVVSHDRYFLEKVVDRIFLIEGRKIVPYEGSFAEYWRDLGAPAARSFRTTTGTLATEDRAAALTRSQKRRESLSKLPTRTDQQRSMDLERRIAELELRKESLEREATRALEARDFSRSGRYSAEAEKTGRLVKKLYEEWLNLA